MNPEKAVAISLAVVMVGFLSLVLYKKRRTYKKVGKVKQLFVYPVKSLRGIEVFEVQCGKFGISVNGIRDRSYMLVSTGGVLISQREEPKLAVLRQDIVGKNIIITGPDMDPFTLDADMNKIKEKEAVKCVIHLDEGEVFDFGDVAAKWFQKFLQREDVRLVCFSEELKSRQSTSQIPFLRTLRKQNPMNLQDAAPLHIIAESSLGDLNTRLNQKTSLKNFRPSVYVEDSAAFDEDNWKYIKFQSGAEVETILPCGRCILTTVNPENGVKEHKDLLSTLRKYRLPKTSELGKLVRYSPCFGTHCWSEREGKIRVGDDIHAVTVDGLFTYKTVE